MQRLINLLIAIIAFVGISCSAQTPVRWRASVTATGENTGVLTIRALVADGWHLYGLELPKNGPKPTSFDLGASADIKFEGTPKPSRAPLKVDDPMFGLTLTWWDSNVEFTIPFKVTGPKPKINCVISFMTCDGTTCRPPARETISTPVKLNKK